MKPLVIFHKHCADGFGAAFAAWLKFGDDAEYLSMKYNWVNTVSEFDAKVGPRSLPRDIYILDFSFPKVVMEALFESKHRVVWLDHHKTAFESWHPTETNLIEESFGERGQHTIILDNNRSGALIAWRFFHGILPPPDLIKHIDDYDRWQFKLEGTREVIKALYSNSPWKFAQWREYIESKDNYSPLRDLYLAGTYLLNAHNQHVIANVNSSSRFCVITFPEHLELQPALGLAANCIAQLTSDVGHALADKSGTYGLVWYMAKGDLCKCSLRSNGDYDVSKIAAAFGGGGHKNAAGFEIEISRILEWVK
jgi:oligoribonuclease NrnB/cAMP/cGMP phosphodiesterase (DHH superfamily)